MNGFKHPGVAWRRCYAAGGVTAQAHGLVGPEPGSTDTYFATEEALVGAPMPAWASNGANDNLAREAARHRGDLTVAELSSVLNREDVGKLTRALALCADRGIEVLFCLHVLNTGPDTDAPRVVVVFPGMPARDRNSPYSERRSCRRHESLRNFLEAPATILAGLQGVSIQEGFCFPLLYAPQSPVTEARNAANCKAMKTAPELDASEDAIAERLGQLRGGSNGASNGASIPMGLG